MASALPTAAAARPVPQYGQDAVAFHHLDRWQEVAVPSNEHGTPYLPCRRQFNHINPQQNVDTLLRENR